MKIRAGRIYPEQQLHKMFAGSIGLKANQEYHPLEVHVCVLFRSYYRHIETRYIPPSIQQNSSLIINALLLTP